jgi:hypothetical protein
VKCCSTCTERRLLENHILPAKKSDISSRVEESKEYSGIKKKGQIEELGHTFRNVNVTQE